MKKGEEMRKVLWLIAALLCLLLMTGCRNREAARAEIFRLVEENYDAIAAACENRDKVALYAIDGIEEVKFRDGYVVAYCTGGGIAPSSQDYGFYYSEENLPAAIDCNLEILCRAADLTPEGKGYQYRDSGYNLFYTEYIIGKIYFYSTSY